MQRATFCVVALLVLGIGWDRSVSQAQSAAQPLVGTWLLTSEQLSVEGAPAIPAQGARGMLVFDRAGYYFELVEETGRIAFGSFARHQGLIFHSILGGGLTLGSTLRRFFDVRGQDVDLTFPAGTNRQGIRSQTFVKLHRLSKFEDMVQ